MSDTSINIVSGLGIPAQIPLNPKQNISNEECHSFLYQRSKLFTSTALLCLLYITSNWKHSLAIQEVISN